MLEDSNFPTTFSLCSCGCIQQRVVLQHSYFYLHVAEKHLAEKMRHKSSVTYGSVLFLLAVLSVCWADGP